MLGKEIEKAKKVKEFINEIREKIDSFTFDQIYMIERGLLVDLPLELIRFCARPEFDAIQMGGIYISYVRGYSLERLQRCITSQLNKDQWREIISWAEYDLDFERFIEELGENLLPETSHCLLEEVRKNLTFGLPWERIKEFIQICKEKNFLSDGKKIKAINKGILAGLTKEEIDAHIGPELGWEQVEQIIEELIKKRENKIYENLDIAVFINLLERYGTFNINLLKQSGKFNERQLREIRLGFANGLTIDQIKWYADDFLSENEMRMMRLHFQAGYLGKQIKLTDEIRKCYMSLDLAQEICLWLRDGLPPGCLDDLIQYFTDPLWLNWWRRKLKKLPKDQIDIYLKKFQSFMTVCKKANFRVEDTVKILSILSKLPDSEIETYSQEIQILAEDCKNDRLGRREIARMILSYLYGLSKEEIRDYRLRGFSGFQIEQIALARLDGLTQKEIEFMTNHKFNDQQMKIIRLGFKFGLSFDQVEKFARPEYDIPYMKEFFLGYLWGLPEELIEFYMNKELRTGNKDTVPTLYDWSEYFTPQTILRITLLKGLTIPEIEFVLKNFVLKNFDPQNGSLKSTLEKHAKDKKARAELRALIAVITELEELKRSISETKGEKKGFTL